MKKQMGNIISLIGISIIFINLGMGISIFAPPTYQIGIGLTSIPFIYFLFKDFKNKNIIITSFISTYIGVIIPYLFFWLRII